MALETDFIKMIHSPVNKNVSSCWWSLLFNNMDHNNQYGSFGRQNYVYVKPNTFGISTKL